MTQKTLRYTLLQVKLAGKDLAKAMFLLVVEEKPNIIVVITGIIYPTTKPLINKSKNA
jgi:hypothetical protein